MGRPYFTSAAVPSLGQILYRNLSSTIQLHSAFRWLLCRKSWRWNLNVRNRERKSSNISVCAFPAVTLDSPAQKESLLILASQDKIDPFWAIIEVIVPSDCNQKAVWSNAFGMIGSDFSVRVSKFFVGVKGCPLWKELQAERRKCFSPSWENQWMFWKGIPENLPTRNSWFRICTGSQSRLRSNNNGLLRPLGMLHCTSMH